MQNEEDINHVNSTSHGNELSDKKRLILGWKVLNILKKMTLFKKSKEHSTVEKKSRVACKSNLSAPPEKTALEVCLYSQTIYIRTNKISYMLRDIERYYFTDVYTFNKLLREFNMKGYNHLKCLPGQVSHERNLSRDSVYSQSVKENSLLIKTALSHLQFPISADADIITGNVSPGHGIELFISVGWVRVSMRMCSRCRDTGKAWNSTDKYYINIVETCRQRTALCSGCLGERLYRMLEHKGILCVSKKSL